MAKRRISAFTWNARGGRGQGFKVLKAWRQSDFGGCRGQEYKTWSPTSAGCPPYPSSFSSRKVTMTLVQAAL